MDECFSNVVVALKWVPMQSASIWGAILLRHDGHRFQCNLHQYFRPEASGLNVGRSLLFSWWPGASRCQRHQGGTVTLLLFSKAPGVRPDASGINVGRSLLSTLGRQGKVPMQAASICSVLLWLGVWARPCLLVLSWSVGAPPSSSRGQVWLRAGPCVSG